MTMNSRPPRRRIAVVTVAGQAGEVGNDGIAALGEPVEQGATCRRWAADDGDDRFQGCSLDASERTLGEAPGRRADAQRSDRSLGTEGVHAAPARVTTMHGGALDDRRTGHAGVGQPRWAGAAGAWPSVLGPGSARSPRSRRRRHRCRPPATPASWRLSELLGWSTSSSPVHGAPASEAVGAVPATATTLRRPPARPAQPAGVRGSSSRVPRVRVGTAHAGLEGAGTERVAHADGRADQVGQALDLVGAAGLGQRHLPRAPCRARVDARHARALARQQGVA
jgi:hypothetical protein